MRKFLAAAAFAATAAFSAAPATAQYDSFGLSPEACIDSVAYFLEDRLYDSRAARIELDSAPYRVMVEFRGGYETQAWAVDVLVKSRLPTGSWSNYQPYTVIFRDGEAIALESDVWDMRLI